MDLRLFEFKRPRDSLTRPKIIRGKAESSKEEQNSEQSDNGSLPNIIGEDVAVCETCSSMFDHLRSLGIFENGGGLHHKSSAALIKAASSGCRICKPLLHHCRRESGSYLDCVSEKWRYKIWSKKHIDGSPIILQTFQGKQYFEYVFKMIQGQYGEEIVEYQERDSNQKFKAGCQAATMWMRQCLENHTKCSNNKQPSSYPTRLLQLSESKVRLVIPSHETISGPYATLSYCWGDVKAEWALTTSNLARRCEEGIALSDLPVASQEAVAFARGLSIYYLWIDSLCIVQSGDEGQDWQMECSRIQNVYENCILNISWAHGKNPLQSYLQQNTNELLYPFVTKIFSTSLSPPPRGFSLLRGLRRNPSDEERDEETYLIVEENFIEKYLIRSPINTRAWVLQEQILSPLVLSLGHGQVFWNCNELGNASESFPRSLRHMRSRERLRSHPGKGFQEQQFFWKAMIERYTGRQLTVVVKDKLIAFSAIAQRMATMTDSIYIAGHFWEQLPESLPWQVLKNQNRARCAQRKNMYVLEDGRQIMTPSWSWASMDGQIEMPIMEISMHMTEPIADMVGFNLDLVDEANPFGQVVSATLVLRAHCAEVQWAGGFPLISNCSITLNNTVSWNDYGVSSWWEIDDPKDDLQEGDICTIAALSKMEFSASIYGLILKEVQGPGMRNYTRIGYYCIKGMITVWQSMELWHGEKRTITLA